MACRATTKAGDPCRATELRDGWCYHHHPDLETERRAAKRKGGLVLHHGASGPEPLEEVKLRGAADVLGILETAASDALSRKPGIERARCLTYVATAAVRVIEASDLEERVRALEQRIQLRGVS